MYAFVDEKLVHFVNCMEVANLTIQDSLQWTIRSRCYIANLARHSPSSDLHFRHNNSIYVFRTTPTLAAYCYQQGSGKQVDRRTYSEYTTIECESF